MSLKRILLASLLAALVAFFWGFLSWTKLGWHNAIKFKDGAAVAKVVKENMSEHGIYMWPEGPESMSDTAGMERYEAQAKAGPVLWVMAHPGVQNNSMGAAMALG